jgi:hypothetical protein
MMSRSSLSLFARQAVFAAALLVASVGVSQASPARPVLIELFTSEGCVSCPPADKLLGELAKQPGVVALAWHVGYLDGMGWKDKFSTRSADERQYDYSERLKLESMYTPQLVVDGSNETVGSDAGAVARLIHAAEQRLVEGPDLTLGHKDGLASVKVGAGNGSGAVWLVAYDKMQTSAVGRGQNAGQTLTEYQVVRKAVRLGLWHGKPLDLPLPQKAAEAEVVFVQPDAPGPMLATLTLDR